MRRTRLPAHRGWVDVTRSLVPRTGRTVLIEAALFAAGVTAYFLVRGATETSLATAQRHADQLVAVQDAVAPRLESILQSAVLPHDWLVALANWVYMYGHWPLIAVVAAGLAWRRPEVYRWLRTAMLVSGAIGVAVFVTYPVAPPRLVPWLGIADTISDHSESYRVLQPTAFVNQYAALPSLHVGWDLLVGLALLRAGVPWALKILAVTAPLAMALTVVATGNHYVIDVLAGTVVALIGAAVAGRWVRTQSHQGLENRDSRPVRLISGREAPEGSQEVNVPRQAVPAGCEELEAVSERKAG